MARQSVTQHLDILVRANLVTVVRRGRERLHYLNPVPIHEIEQRWISGFDKPAPAGDQRHQEPGRGVRHDRRTRHRPDYVYVTYIRASAGAGVAGADRRRSDRPLLGTRQRLGLAARLDLGTPARRRLRRRRRGRPVVEAEPPTRLVITFEDAPDAGPARALGRHVPRRAAPGHRPPHRHPREPAQPGDARRDLARLAGRAGEPQVAAGDRRRPTAGAVGDVARARLTPLVSASRRRGHAWTPPRSAAPTARCWTPPPPWPNDPAAIHPPANGTPTRSWRTSPSSPPSPIAAAARVAAGTNTTYDNRIAHDTWTLDRVIALAGGNAGLRERIRRQGEALCAFGGSALSEAELDTLGADAAPVPRQGPRRSAHAAAGPHHGSGGGGAARPHETAPGPAAHVPQRGRSVIGWRTEWCCGRRGDLTVADRAGTRHRGGSPTPDAAG